jgi:tetratricopeptide (TPR) repeat protein
MNVVCLELKPIDRQFAELRYWLPGQTQYQSRKLQLAEIEGLYDFIDRDFTTTNPHLAQLGRKLFDWLDGTERWLAQAIAQNRGGLVLAIAFGASEAIDAQEQLGGLPWEVMFYEGFLVARSIIPVRVLGAFHQTKPARVPAPRQLRTLFMATDPIDVSPSLDFEAEEALILQETQDLAMDLRVEESGCLEELKGFWRRFPQDHFDIFHLSGHANIRDGVPYFITESPEGNRVDAQLADFDAVFRLRYPPLMFLSGCRTAQSGRSATTSLAASLVQQGAPAVLGWGRPVADKGAIAAAMVLYKSLAAGVTLAESLVLTYQDLIQADVPDWCLLRLYAEFGAWDVALVLPPADDVRCRPAEASDDEEFLDPQGLVRVAGKNAFVGRRRYLQRGLKALKSPNNLGIWLHGLRGAGKSSIACRLLDRLMPAYHKLVFTGIFDESLLVNKLCEYYPDKIEALATAGSLTHRLMAALKDIDQRQNERIVFLLDNFEDNLELRSDGQPVLKAAVVEPLRALLNSIAKSGVLHRVIVTSRYDVVLPGNFDRKMQPLEVVGMGKDTSKLYRRLPAFQANSGVDEDLQSKAQKIADGYPRLMWWLNDVLQDERTDSELILIAMEEKQLEFLESILAEGLLAQQEPGLVEMLERGMLFELPVPLAVLQSICVDLVGFEGFVKRARALGLLELGLSDDLVRVPRVLGLVVPSNQQELAAIGVKVLHQTWFEEAEFFNEEQLLETYRLAMLGRNAEIAIEMAQRLSSDWINRSRYREARDICEKTLFLQKNSTIIHNLSIIYQTLGDLPYALALSQQSIEIKREIGDRKGEAASLYQMSIIYQILGDLTQSLALSQQSIEILREIGDRKGEATSLHQLSNIYQILGDLTQSLALSQQSIEIKREIGDRRGEADSLHQMSIIYQILGDLVTALALSQQSIEIDREIGNRQGEAASLHQMSIIYQTLEDSTQALALSEQSIKMHREIGNRQGEADSLHMMSIIYQILGDSTQALALSEQSIKMHREIGNRQGEAGSLHQMATIAGQQGDAALQQDLYLQAATLLGAISDYGRLIDVLNSLGINDEPDAIGYLAQALWLTLKLPTNLQRAITLISYISRKIPTGDPLKSLLGAAAIHLCHHYKHPELDQLIELSGGIILYAAEQQGITTQADYNDWIIQNRLNDPDYFLPLLINKLESIVGDSWLFDKAVFLKGNRSA